MQINAPLIVSDIPSSAALLGTTGSAQLLQTINESQGSAISSNFFGGVNDMFSSISNSFIKNVVQPIREIGSAVRDIAIQLSRPDQYTALNNVEAFRRPPPIMYNPILTYKPIKKLLQQGRISGYGIDPDTLPEEDIYGRLCVDNGTVDLSTDISKDDVVVFEWNFKTDDPILTSDEMIAVSDTRDVIDYILEYTNIDPTDPDNERG